MKKEKAAYNSFLIACKNSRCVHQCKVRGTRFDVPSNLNLIDRAKDNMSHVVSEQKIM